MVIEQINFTNVYSNLTLSTDLSCITNGNIDSTCAYKQITGQMNTYFVNVGITICIIWLLYTWFMFLYQKYWHKKYYFNNFYTGDLREIQNVMYLDLKLRHFLQFASCIFIYYVIMFNI